VVFFVFEKSYFGRLWDQKMVKIGGLGPKWPKKAQILTPFCNFSENY